MYRDDKNYITKNVSSPILELCHLAPNMNAIVPKRPDQLVGMHFTNVSERVVLSEITLPHCVSVVMRMVFDDRKMYHDVFERPLTERGGFRWNSRLDKLLPEQNIWKRGI